MSLVLRHHIKTLSYTPQIRSVEDLHRGLSGTQFFDVGTTADDLLKNVLQNQYNPVRALELGR